MRTTTLEEAFNGERFFDYASEATYKVKALDTVIDIKIPTTIAAALNDKRFSYQWRIWPFRANSNRNSQTATSSRP